jgi:hypothetical protein
LKAAYIHSEETSRIITLSVTEQNSENHKKKHVKTTKPLTLAELEKTFQAAADLPLKLSDASWITRYHIHHRSVNKYSEGRVFLAGDAAHIHSPAGGQGMNTGLQDAANLVWKLALALKDGDKNKLLATYNAERWPIGQKLLHFTDKLFGKVSTQKKWQTTLRNILVPLLIKLVSKSQYCKTKFFRFVSELGIRYHGNEFLRDDHSGLHLFSKKLKAGCRAPNGIIKRNYDLFDLIHGYQFHVVALSKKALTTDEINKIVTELASIPKNIGLPIKTHFIAHALTTDNKKVIQAESNNIFANYGLTDENPSGLFLIRPDGYIAYQANDIDVAKLNDFINLFK